MRIVGAGGGSQLVCGISVVAAGDLGSEAAYNTGQISDLSAANFPQSSDQVTFSVLFVAGHATIPVGNYVFVIYDNDDFTGGEIKANLSGNRPGGLAWVKHYWR